MSRAAGHWTATRSRITRLRADTRRLAHAIRNDEGAVVEGILSLSRSRRLLAPLALTVGAFSMFMQGLRVLVTDWRLLAIQIVPAMWIWLAMLDLKLHVLKGHSFHDVRGAILIPLGLLVVAITVGCFFLNAVFAFAIAGDPRPTISEAAGTARRHLAPIVTSGVVVGAMLAVATLLAPRWSKPWFALTLGVVVGVMMISYVALPARMVGMRRAASRRDKVAASMISGAVSATVCTPPYLLGRIGILMLGSRVLLVPGIVLLVLGAGLQAGATGAVRAIKMSAVLATGGDAGAAAPAGPERAP
jgi:hypothetical protein